MTWALAEDYPRKLTKAVIINVPHFAVFAQAIRTNYRQMCRSWYICELSFSWPFLSNPLLPAILKNDVHIIQMRLTSCGSNNDQ